MKNDESSLFNDRLNDIALLRIIKALIDVGASQHDNRGDFLTQGALQPGLAGAVGMQQKGDIGSETDDLFVKRCFPMHVDLDGHDTVAEFFETFLKSLKQQNINPRHVAGVITESYQGVGPFFLPKDYAQRLEAFCRENDALLIFDEVQAGFGRTGKWYTFEHYDVTADLIACGKGISSSLPISAVIGRADVMDLYQPGSMTSTHSGSPLPVAAAVANIKALKNDKLVEHAAAMEPVLMGGLEKIRAKHPGQIGYLTGKGLVAGMQIVKAGTKEGDAATAVKINEACFRQGLLMFAPVGVGGICIKICPPLCTPQDALEEGISVLAKVCDEILT